MTKKIIFRVIGGIVILAIGAGLVAGRGIFNEKIKSPAFRARQGKLISQ